MLLETYKKEIHTPLVVMGASFVDSANFVNITKNNQVANRKLNPLQIGNDRDIETQALKMKEFLYCPDKDVQQNLDLTYQEWNAQIEPAWNSRFIKRPKTLPSEEQLKKYEKVKIDLDEKGEQDGEFDEYIFKDFLKEIKDEMEKVKMTEEERYKYILQDIEKDRERILKEAIDSIKRPFKK